LYRNSELVALLAEVPPPGDRGSDQNRVSASGFPIGRRNFDHMY